MFLPLNEDTEINQTWSLSSKSLQLVKGQKTYADHCNIDLRGGSYHFECWAEWRWHLAIKYALDLSAKEGKSIPSRDNGMNKVSEVGKGFLVGRTQDHYDMNISRSWTHFRDQVSEETWVKGQVNIWREIPSKDIPTTLKQLSLPKELLKLGDALEFIILIYVCVCVCSHIFKFFHKKFSKRQNTNSHMNF